MKNIEDPELEIILKEFDVKLTTAGSPDAVKIIVKQEKDAVEKYIQLKYKK